MVDAASSSVSSVSIASSPSPFFNSSAAIESRMAAFAARWHSSARSAPLKPSVFWATKFRGTSRATGDFLSVASRMPSRAGRSGSGMYMSWSSRPGRSSASSSSSGRFVAPMKKRFFLTPTPSISVSSWFMTLSPAPPASPMDEPRDVPMESSSSKKSTQGAAARALSNTSRTLASDSPNHMVRSSGPLMLTKLAEHSDATALASNVLPHPGGP
mmetsp:Transcript_37045/g.92915  ORF Transcript_37045/g.92915 Transcript_37045/m.92915 type:complete len:214 (+) Transcript_37045:1229-1870(+)